MNFKELQTEQKLRGGYYTPEDLADFLTRWVAGANPESILEPSCGDGVFFNRIASHMGNQTVATYIAVDPENDSISWSLSGGRQPRLFHHGRGADVQGVSRL
jgi:adenine-specific DNA-methyltransferase